MLEGTLDPTDWASGDQVWGIELIAPYEMQTGSTVLRNFLGALTPRVQSMRYIRMKPGSDAKRFVETFRDDGGAWRARLLSPEHFKS